jgi:hypothetical protein
MADNSQNLGEYFRKICNVLQIKRLLYIRVPILNGKMFWNLYLNHVPFLKKGELFMFSSIDVKSFLIGSLLVFSVVCLIGAVPYMQPKEYGRFQI